MVLLAMAILEILGSMGMTSVTDHYVLVLEMSGQLPLMCARCWVSMTSP